MIVWLSPFHVPRRSGTAVCARAAFAAIKPVRVTIIASFDIASLLMWRTSRHLSGHAFGGCIARAQSVSRRSTRPSSSGLPPRPGDGLCDEHTGLLSWRSAWFSVPIRVASSQCQQGSRAEGKSAHRKCATDSQPRSYAGSRRISARISSRSVAAARLAPRRCDE